MKTLLLSIAFIMTFMVNMVEAQWRAPFYPQYPNESGPYYVNTAPHHASTVFEGIYRGRADEIRALGDYNLKTSMAKQIMQEAYQKNMENRLMAIENYFKMREINRQNRFPDHSSKPSSKSIVNRERVNDRAETTGPALVNSQTGRVNWPTALQDSSFISNRKVIERIVAKYSNLKDASASDQSDLKSAGQTMKKKLQENINKYSSQDYMTAKIFLDNLSSILTHEAES